MRRITGAFVLISAVFSGLFATLFVLDLRGFFNLAQDPVAFLKTTNGTVRRLANKELTWDRAEQGTLFGAGDTISTGEMARAKLVFYAGGELDLDAGAMVVLAGNVDELKLDFVSGTGRIRVAKEAAKKITVADTAASRITGGSGKNPTSRVQIALVEKMVVPTAPPKQVLSFKAQTAKAEVEVKAAAQVVSGAAAVGNNPTKGEVSDARSGDIGSSAPADPTATVVADGAVKTDVADKTDAADKADLAAAAPSDPENEVAQESLISLAPAIREEKIREPEKALGAGKKEVAGEIISAIKLPPVPAIKFPASDTVIDLGVQRGSKLEWEMPEDFKASEYEIVVRPADGKGMERVLRSKNTSLALNQLTKGKYLWSVRALDEKGKRGPASDARWLEVRVPANMAKPKVLPVKIE